MTSKVVLTPGIVCFIVSFTFFVALSEPLYARPGSRERQIDSLLQALKLSNDTATTLIYLELSKRMILDSATRALEYCSKSREMSFQLGYNNGKALYYDLMASYNMILFNQIGRARLYLDSAQKYVKTSFASRVVFTSWSCYYYLNGQDNKGYESALTALRLNGTKEDRVTADIYQYLGLCANRIGKHRAAKKYLNKLYEISYANNMKGFVGGALSNLANVYLSEDKLDSALLYFQKLYRFELQYGNPKDNVLLLSGLGTVYQAKNQRDTAFYFLKNALAAANRVERIEGYGGIYNALARYYAESKTDSGLYYGWKAKLYTRGASREFETTLFILALCHKNLHRYDSAFFYLDQYRIIRDSVLNQTRMQQINELEEMYQSELKDSKIERLSAQRKADQLKSFLLTAGIVAVVVISIIIYYLLQLKLRARREEIILKNTQLNDYVKKVVEKSELVEELRAQVEKLEKQSGKSEQIENLTTMLNASLLTEEDWLEFKSVFEKVHRNFFAILRSLYPDLTTSEIRLSALIKLNLQTREMANMLGISVDSVGKARKRLRKSLNLSPDQDLRQFIEAITESGQMAA